MSKILHRIRHFFKTDTDIFITRLNDNRLAIDRSIRDAEKHIQFIKAALSKQIALGKYFHDRTNSLQLRIDSLNVLILHYVKNNKDAAAREILRERVKEQQKLKGLQETIKLHEQRIKECQFQLKAAMYDLDNMKIRREAFVIKQHIAIEEIKIFESLYKGNPKELMEKIQYEILDIETYKLLDSNEDVLSDIQIDNEIEREMANLKASYS